MVSRKARAFYPDQFTEDWIKTMLDLGRRGEISRKICQYIFEGVKRELMTITDMDERESYINRMILEDLR